MFCPKRFHKPSANTFLIQNGMLPVARFRGLSKFSIGLQAGCGSICLSSMFVFVFVFVSVFVFIFISILVPHLRCGVVRC